MNRLTAQIIIRDFPQDGLEDYVQNRLEVLSKEFETVKTDNLGNLQGRISEVKLLLSIRKHAQDVLDQARKTLNG